MGGKLTQLEDRYGRSRLVLAAVFLSIVALGVTVWRLVLPMLANDPLGPYQQISIWTEEENAIGQRLWEGIYRPMMRRGSIGMEDMRTLREHAMASDSYQTRQLAYGIMAECLDYSARMPDAARDLIVQTHYEMLSDPDYRVRLDGVAQCHGSGLLVYPHIRAAVLAMEDDPHDLVGYRVRLIDWDKVDRADDGG